MSMKVEDLMIGDWIQYQYTGGIFQIVEISKTEGIKQFEDQPFFKLNGIIPIPLTPEILKKNGFVNSYIDLSLNKDSVYKYNHFYTGNSVIVDMESNKLIVKYENNIWMNLPYNRTIYVHELQHVLKHCEIKKEIII